MAGTLDSIFGAVDIPCGWMNVVSWKNLEGYGLNFSLQPSKPVQLSFGYHYFRLAQSQDAWYWVTGRSERRAPTSRSGQDPGHELDFILRWQVNKEIELLAGYAIFYRHLCAPHARWRGRRPLGFYTVALCF